MKAFTVLRFSRHALKSLPVKHLQGMYGNFYIHPFFFTSFPQLLHRLHHGMKCNNVIAPNGNSFPVQPICKNSHILVVPFNR
jgi:hypothetical protein